MERLIDAFAAGMSKRKLAERYGHQREQRQAAHPAVWRVQAVERVITRLLAVITHRLGSEHLVPAEKWWRSGSRPSGRQPGCEIPGGEASPAGGKAGEARSASL